MKRTGTFLAGKTTFSMLTGDVTIVSIMANHEPLPPEKSLKRQTAFADIIFIEMSKTWPKRKSVEGKQEQIAEQPAKKSAKTRRGMEPSL